MSKTLAAGRLLSALAALACAGAGIAADTASAPDRRPAIATLQSSASLQPAAGPHEATRNPQRRVRVWQGTLDLPSSIEAAPNPNPPFDLFGPMRSNYPYTLRDALTDREQVERWRALFLENEYLQVTVLPDLGGHIYRCLDKVTGRELFYANPSIKKALIGYRGAWAAFGVEFNFPVSHNWVSMSPVDFATTQNEDGTASIWVGNTDIVYGSSWRVELRLAAGVARLEQHVTLENRSDVRHRYYWWTNAAVQAWDDSRLVYPTTFMATHGFTRVVPWPVDGQGRDLSVIRNQTDGPVSLFTYGTREPFVGVYHPHTDSGTVHLADPADLPTHKVWSWGFDRDAAQWREALSDNHSAYVELQAGLFRNQETYAFLDPQHRVSFTEYWLPVHALGGITRATRDAVFHAERTTPDHLRLAMNVVRAFPGARVRVTQADRTLLDSVAGLTPKTIWRADVSNVQPAVPWTIQVISPAGTPILSHTEDMLALVPRERIAVGPQPAYRYPAPAARQAADLIDLGRDEELQGRRLAAMAIYADGVKRFPQSVALNRAAGRLATALHWNEAAGGRSTPPIEWLSYAVERDTTDMDARYYLGLALAAAGDDAAARAHFEAAQRFADTRVASLLQLARLDARADDLEGALRNAAAAVATDPGNTLARAIAAICARRRGDRAHARRYLAPRELDPANTLLRYERTRLGGDDPALWAHLAGDANRILDLTDQYLALGAFDDARDLLERSYVHVPELQREPGVPEPARHALVAYYRAYVLERLGQPAADAYRAASMMPTAYVFPGRASTFAVLRAALRNSADAASAHFLLGSLQLAAGRTDDAVAAWQRARALDSAIPTLHRNLGLTLLLGRHDVEAARQVLLEGVSRDAANVEVYEALDQVQSLLRVPARDRVEALARFPATARPASLTYKLALALAEDGRAEQADEVFHGQYFPREEGGTGVRAVYAQVRLLHARSLARQQSCDQALTVAGALTRDAAGLPFTAGGLEDVLRSPQLQLQLAEIEAACGRGGDAQARWTAVARSGSAEGASPMQVALGYGAARAGGDDLSSWTSRVERALAQVEATIDAGNGNAAGTLHYARALLLDALNRPADRDAALLDVLRQPDRNLSHHLARAALVRE